MSIWGKIVGGAAGFAIGGPLGALLGALAGHAVDEYRADPADGDQPDQTKSIAFTIGVIALGAKMAKADGAVHRVEVDAFKRVFQVPSDELKNVGRLFDLAKKDTAGFEAYAQQLADMFKDRKPVLEELLGGLFHIATADHVIHQGELAFLRRVADIFGFTREEFEQSRRIHGGANAGFDDPLDDPYAVLGLHGTESFPEVKGAYRTLVRENHPDRLIAEGMPKEFIDLAQEKMAAINAAYEKIEKSARVSG